MRKQEQISLLDALLWAQNELSHEVDETNCCYVTCQSCKNIKNNAKWKDWWNRGINPVDIAIQQAK